jgi:hypothetical protein
VGARIVVVTRLVRIGRRKPGEVELIDRHEVVDVLFLIVRHAAARVRADEDHFATTDFREIGDVD